MSAEFHFGEDDMEDEIVERAVRRWLPMSELEMLLLFGEAGFDDAFEAATARGMEEDAALAHAEETAEEVIRLERLLRLPPLLGDVGYLELLERALIVDLLDGVGAITERERAEQKRLHLLVRASA